MYVLACLYLIFYIAFLFTTHFTFAWDFYIARCGSAREACGGAGIEGSVVTFSIDQLRSGLAPVIAHVVVNVKYIFSIRAISV